jgi:predicted transcriptional regulator
LSEGTAKTYATDANVAEATKSIASTKMPTNPDIEGDQIMTTQLMNFNIPKGLKADLDRIAQHRNVSRTAIIITPIEGYCRNEWKEIEEAMRMQRRVEDARRLAAEDCEAQEPPMPIFDDDADWKRSYDVAAD